ncbi:MAG: sensor histidine kinase [Terriglobia bacterium]|nr:MAG: sensor histidine kinase [Terriglobia bacterium]
MGPRIGHAPAVQPPRWLWIALIWLSIGMFDASDTVFSMRAEGHHHAWLSLFVTLLLSWLPWALATPWILNLARRYPLELKSPFAWLPHLAACAATGLAYAAWTAALEELFNPWLQSEDPGHFLPLLLAKFFNRLLSFLILYASIVAIGYVLDSRRRLALQETESARLNELLTRAQLDVLRRQIEPHFLFNTLNGIAALVREERNDAAVQMIAALSDFLRRIVEGAVKHEVALAEELDFLQKYLDIQKVRFAERLLLRVDVPDELLGAKVPSLLLQPIVENSIKHGITKRAHGGEIRIAATRCGGMLTLNVYNDGPNLTMDNGGARIGTGIFNLRSRLSSLYGSTFHLTMRNQGPGGVEVSVSVPFREN